MANSVEVLKGVILHDSHPYYVRDENRKRYRIKKIDKRYLREGQVIVFLPMKHKWRGELWVKDFIAIEAPQEHPNYENYVNATIEYLKKRSG